VRAIVIVVATPLPPACTLRALGVAERAIDAPAGAVTVRVNVAVTAVTPLPLAVVVSE
jgi:hypothetical protein